MIDLKALRDHPQRFIDGSAKKNVAVDIPRLIELDEQRRALLTEQESLRAAQNKLSKETGPKIGQLMGKLKGASEDEKPTIQAEIDEIKAAPAKMKDQISALDSQIAEIEPELVAIHLSIPQPADDDVPVGTSADDNIELSKWAPRRLGLGQELRRKQGLQAPHAHRAVRDARSGGLPARGQDRRLAFVHPQGRRHAPAPGDPAVRLQHHDQRERVHADERARARPRRSHGRHRILPGRARSGVPHQRDRPRRRLRHVPHRHRRGRAHGHPSGRNPRRVQAPP